MKNFIKNSLGAGIYSINAAAFILGAAGLVSRLLGIFRDRMLAAHFGAGRELDIYYAAFQIPDFMAVLFLLGAASSAILPVFQEYLARDREEARRFIDDMSHIFILGAATASLVVFFLAPFLIRLIVPGFSVEEREITVALTRIMLLSPIFFGLSGIFSAVVESFGRFFAYALAPILYNLGIIIGIAVFVPMWGIKGLAFGVILGAILHFGIQFLTVSELGFSPRLLEHDSWFSRIGTWLRSYDLDNNSQTQCKDHFISSGVKRVMTISFPRVISISLSNLTLLALVAIASTLDKGSIAVFQLAQNLYYLPVGIFGVSYAVAIFPRLSRSYIKKDAESFFQNLFMGIHSILFWIMPASVLLIVLRAHVVRVALGAGVFSWEDTRLTAALLAVFAAALFAGGLMSLFIRGFYALENTWRPLFINLGASAASILMSWRFSLMFSSKSDFALFVTRLFRIEDLPHPEILGLGLGFSLGLAANIFFLWWVLGRLANARFGRRESISLAPLFKILIGSILAGAAAYLTRVSFSETLPLISFIQVLLQGVVAGLVGLVVYFTALFLMREEMVNSLWKTFRSRLFGVGVLPSGWDDRTDLH
jgi:putative peptidoglycan lipid II flippase